MARSNKLSRERLDRQEAVGWLYLLTSTALPAGWQHIEGYAIRPVGHRPGGDEGAELPDFSWDWIVHPITGWWVRSDRPYEDTIGFPGFMSEQDRWAAYADLCHVAREHGYFVPSYVGEEAEEDIRREAGVTRVRAWRKLRKARKVNEAPRVAYCTYCGEPFTPRRWKQGHQFCSPAHRAAYNRRVR